MTNQQDDEDYAVVTEYDDEANTTRELLEHHMDGLKSSTSKASPSLENGSEDRRAAISSRTTVPATRVFGERLREIEGLHVEGAMARWQSL